MGVPINLTQNLFPPGFQYHIFSTACAIVRSTPDTSPTKIVVSYGLNKRFPLPRHDVPYCATLSLIGGVWTVINNGPVNGLGFSTLYGDCRGVISDKYGNVWYSTTNRGDLFPPRLYVSTDNGLTFVLAYIAPLPNPGDIYDYPQICLGGGPDPITGTPQYGIWMVTRYINGAFTLVIPNVTFIPIYGAGYAFIGENGTSPLPGSPIPPSTQNNTYLTAFNLNVALQSLAASSDGRFFNYCLGGSGYQNASLVTTSQSIFSKAPGPIDMNYAGPFDVATINQGLINSATSYPAWGYPTSPQSLIFDDARQALYGLLLDAVPYTVNTQNMRLRLTISRNNGQTWSDPIKISNSDLGNRGFASMALDPISGNLFFGWYDGRGDPSLTSVSQYVALIKAKELTKMVNELPVSDPLYELGPQGVPNPPISMLLTKETAETSSAETPADLEAKLAKAPAMIRHRLKARFGDEE